MFRSVSEKARSIETELKSIIDTNNAKALIEYLQTTGYPPARPLTEENYEDKNKIYYEVYVGSGDNDVDILHYAALKGSDDILFEVLLPHYTRFFNRLLSPKETSSVFYSRFAVNNIVDRGYKTLLHAAAEGLNVSTIDKLLRMDALIYQKDTYGDTPLSHIIKTIPIADRNDKFYATVSILKLYGPAVSMLSVSEEDILKDKRLTKILIPSKVFNAEMAAAAINPYVVNRSKVGSPPASLAVNVQGGGSRKRKNRKRRSVKRGRRASTKNGGR